MVLFPEGITYPTITFFHVEYTPLSHLDFECGSSSPACLLSFFAEIVSTYRAFKKCMNVFQVLISGNRTATKILILLERARSSHLFGI